MTEQPYGQPDGTETQAPDAPETETQGTEENPAQTPEQDASTTDPAERQRQLDEERRAQQRAAGKDEDAEPQPLAGSGNEGVRPTHTIGDQEFDLPLDTSVALKSQAKQSTAVGSDGVPRVIERYVDDWTPAPVEPDPAEVARLEKAQEVLDAHRAEHERLLGRNVEAAPATEAPAEEASA